MDKHEITKRAIFYYEDELQYAIARDDVPDIDRCRTRASVRLGREMDGQDTSAVWLGFIEGIAKRVERGFEVDLSAGEMRIGGVLRTGTLRLVVAEKAREHDLIEWDALREQKLREFVEKRGQERPLVQSAVSRMREMGGDPTLIEACPDWFATASEETEAA